MRCTSDLLTRCSRPLAHCLLSTPLPSPSCRPTTGSPRNLPHWPLRARCLAYSSSKNHSHSVQSPHIPPLANCSESSHSLNPLENPCSPTTTPLSQSPSTLRSNLLLNPEHYLPQRDTPLHFGWSALRSTSESHWSLQQSLLLP